MKKNEVQSMGCNMLLTLRLICAGILAVNALCLMTNGARIAKRAEKLLGK